MARHNNAEIERLIVETIYELVDFENPPELVIEHQLVPVSQDQHTLVRSRSW